MLPGKGGAMVAGRGAVVVSGALGRGIGGLSLGVSLFSRRDNWGSAGGSMPAVLVGGWLTRPCLYGLADNLPSLPTSPSGYGDVRWYSFVQITLCPLSSLEIYRWLLPLVQAFSAVIVLSSLSNNALGVMMALAREGILSNGVRTELQRRGPPSSLYSDSLSRVPTLGRSGYVIV
ncbi:hypothetical protein Acr_00g0088980 [Actinidia rufa]|uniref:Uncharacterized protein n=1 Tax=Actinidia rufa TaxID=165716 RepID=A0A7J0DWI2_9ERIC|nr:hypothetical protein Acr_00g0088980 [Actinidia rufa]